MVGISPYSLDTMISWMQPKIVLEFEGDKSHASGIELKKCLLWIHINVLTVTLCDVHYQ